MIKAFLITRLFCEKKIALDTTFEFLGAVLGFCVYREIWRPFNGQLLKCDFVNGNLFDIFTIKVCRSFVKFVRPKKFW